MRYIHIYDIASLTWYMQPTTAESDTFPAGRIEACAVAATAPDKSSYNIYVHGGYQGTPNNHTLSGGLWILTLPTFHWIRSHVGLENTNANPRCTKIHQKLMLIQQTVWDSNMDDSMELKIVDLVSLEWVTNIGVSGGDLVYQVPKLVSNAIEGK